MHGATLVLFYISYTICKLGVLHTNKLKMQVCNS